MKEEEKDDDQDEIHDDASEFEDENIDPNFDSCFYSDNNSEISENEDEKMEIFEDIKMWEHENNHTAAESTYYYGRNRFKWSSRQPDQCSSKSFNDKQGTATLRFDKNIPDSPLQYWSQFFNGTMEGIVMEHTNRKLALKFKSKNDTETKPLDEIELRAFFGLLVYTSVLKANRESLNSLFATDGTGIDIFRCTMSKTRFLAILACLRFDNSLDRKERLLNDPMAAISEIFNIFIENCQRSYSLGTHVCVEEMLVEFRGKCKFKVFMPEKSSKYGIKIMALTDAQSHYVTNAYIYYGKKSDSSKITNEKTKSLQPTQAVLRLCSAIEGSNRNVMTHKKFTSVNLVKKLRERQLTFFGMIGKNAKEIPVEFLPNTARLVGSSIYGFSQDMTLVSFVPNKNEAVILISSMHQGYASDATTNKPKILSDYEYLKTKQKFDSPDKQFSIYSCSRRTQGWPLAIFLRLIDISTHNCYILSQSPGNTCKISRADFLKSLARNLVVPHLQRREHNKRLFRSLRQTIQMILGSDSRPEPIVEQPFCSASKAAKLCYICPNKLKRKTKHFCLECKKPMCMGCSKRVCVNCAITEMED